MLPCLLPCSSFSCCCLSLSRCATPVKSSLPRGGDSNRLKIWKRPPNSSTGLAVLDSRPPQRAEPEAPQIPALDSPSRRPCSKPNEVCVCAGPRGPLCGNLGPWTGGARWDSQRTVHCVAQRQQPGVWGALREEGKADSPALGSQLGQLRRGEGVGQPHARGVSLANACVQRLGVPQLSAAPANPQPPCLAHLPRPPLPPPLPRPPAPV